MVARAKEIVLFPEGAPNETCGFPGPETRTPTDGYGCGQNRSMACDHIFNVSNPTLTPFIVANGTGGAIIVAPGDPPAFVGIRIKMALLIKVEDTRTWRGQRR